MKLADRIIDLTTQGITIGFEFNPVLESVHTSAKKGRWVASTDLSLYVIENVTDIDSLLVDAINNAVKKL